MENNPNDVLRARLEEIKGASDKISIADMVNDVEGNQIPETNIDISKLERPDVNELMKPVKGGVDMGPDLGIDLRNHTVNNQAFDESTYQPQTIDTVQQPETEKISAAERARRYKEANNYINTDNSSKIVPEIEDNSADNVLQKGIDSITEDSKKKSEYLYQLAAQQEAAQAEEEEKKKMREKGMIESDDIDDIIENISDNVTKKELDLSEEDDLSLLIQRIEEQKVYVDIPHNKELTGPSSYVVEDNEAYKADIEAILNVNGMRIVKKNNKTKDAILNRFVNSGPHVSMTLPNSGMYISISGAGTDEIIAMQSMTESDQVRSEIDKLSHVAKHIVDSSVGVLKLSQLLDVVSYYDMDTLYYGLYAASYPDISEFQQNCARCGETYYVNVRTRDLLLNPQDFEVSQADIKDNVTTLIHLVERSKLGKIYKKVHSNGMVIYVKHPSIKSYLETLRALDDTTMRRYPRLVDMVYSIDKIAVHVSGDEFMEITDPNEIIDIMGKFKDPKDKYEIFEMVEEIRPTNLPTYGIKAIKCPHCQAENAAHTYYMEDMIFTQAQDREQMEAMRWAAKNQKKKKDESNKSKAE